MKVAFFPLVLCSLFAIASCSETESPANTATTTKDTTTSSTASCYAEQYGKDISVLQLKQDKNIVQGYYTYEPYEKDRGYGTFTGKVSDDKITAQLTYLMEGGVNTEQAVFKLVDGNLVQGVGEINATDDGVITLKDPTKLEWKNTYKRIDCNKVKESIKYAMNAEAEIKKGVK